MSKRKKSAKPEFFDVPVAGMDGGTTNFGLGLIKLSKKRRPKILGCGMLKEPIKSLLGNDLFPQAKIYIRQMRRFMRLHTGALAVGAERYQTRGVRGKTIEIVTTMNSLTFQYCLSRDIFFGLFIAGTWKNAWNREFGKGNLDKVYSRVGKLFGRAPKSQSHKVDAVLLAIYIANGQTFKGIKLTKKFWRGFKRGIEV